MGYLFFDIINKHSRCYDYHGSNFKRLDDAIDAASLMALGLGNSETENWVGGEVRVQNSSGQTLFSIPVVMAA
jgi:hypothetical protein